MEQKDQPVLLFIDTNVLLHCRSLDQLDFGELAIPQEVVVAIANPVVHELDRLKYDPRERPRMRATAALNLIGDLLGGGDPVMRNGIRVLHITARLPDEAVPPEFDFRNVDDQIVIFALQAHKERRYSAVKVLTNDLSMRLRAMGQGIDAFSPPSSWRLPAEPDETTLLREKIRSMESARPRLTLGFANEQGHYKAPDLRILLPDRGCFLAERERQAPKPDKANMVAFLFPELPHLARIRERVDQYESLVESYYMRCAQYYEAVESYNRWLEEHVELAPVLRNLGAAPANDILVFPECDPPISLAEFEPPLRPSLPEAPPPMNNEAEVDRYAHDLSVGNLRPAGLTIDDIDSQLIRIAVGRLNHTLSSKLYSIVAEFPRGTRGFGVRYRINTPSLPEEITGSLNVVLPASS